MGKNKNKKNILHTFLLPDSITIQKKGQVAWMDEEKEEVEGERE